MKYLKYLIRATLNEQFHIEVKDGDVPVERIGFVGISRIQFTPSDPLENKEPEICCYLNNGIMVQLVGSLVSEQFLTQFELSEKFVVDIVDLTINCPVGNKITFFNQDGLEATVRELLV